MFWYRRFALCAIIIAGGMQQACQTLPRGTTVSDLMADELAAPEAALGNILQGLPPPSSEMSAYIKLQLASTTSFVFAIDPSTISIAPATIVRYSLLSQSDLGARSFTYEALRCATRERKIYAVARPAQPWKPAPQIDWQRLTDFPTSDAQRMLYAEVFCDGKNVAGDLDVLRSRLKRGGILLRDQPGN